MELSEIKKALRGLPIDPKAVYERVADHADLRLNPETFVLTRGAQKWGSGGYGASYDVLLGDLGDHELIDEAKGSSQFIWWESKTYRANPNAPLVVYVHEYDAISADGHRCFVCALYVVNPRVPCPP